MAPGRLQGHRDTATVSSRLAFITQDDLVPQYRVRRLRVGLTQGFGGIVGRHSLPTHFYRDTYPNSI